MPYVRYLQLELLEGPAKDLNLLTLCYPETCQGVVNDKHRIRIFEFRPGVMEAGRPVPRGAGVYSPEEFIERLVAISAHKPATRAARRLIATSHPELAKQLQVEAEDDKQIQRKGATIEELADEFKTEPRRIRKLLRKLGMKAPYDDDAVLRSAIKGALKKYRKILYPAPKA